MKRRHTAAVLIGLSLVIATLSIHADEKTVVKKKKKPAAGGVMSPTVDTAELPRVLIIGDSISVGYTLPVRALLAGKANVHRIPVNGGPTTRGLEFIEEWLGTEPWDLIHFNWGLHDLKRMGDKEQVPIEEYRTNMEKLVVRLKETGAILIWCSTTPVPEGTGNRTDDNAIKYNAVCSEIMKKHEVRTNDLYTFAKTHLAEIQQPRNVHFTQAGSQKLAEQVAAAITAALAK